MKRLTTNYILFIALLALAFSAFDTTAQTLDSLRDLSQKYLEEDTIRANILIDYAKELYRSGKFENAITTGESARNLSVKIKFKVGEGHALLAIGYALYKKSEYKQALSYYEQAEEIFKALNRNSDLAKCFLYSGQAYDFLAQYDKSLNYYFKALQLIKDQPYSKNQASLLNSIAINYFNRASYDIAIDYYYKALEISEALKDKRLIASISINLGAAYEKIEQFDDALTSYQRALPLVQELDNKTSIALTKANIGGVYVHKKLFASAEVQLKEALALQQKINDRRGLVYSLSNLGNLFYERKQLIKAESFYLQAISMALSIEDLESALNPALSLTDLYVQLGRFKEAEYYVLWTRNLSTEIGTPFWLEQNYLMSSKLDSAQHNYQGSLKWYKQYTHLKDSLFNHIKTEQIVQIKELYEAERKDAEILQLQKAQLSEAKNRALREKIFITLFIAVTFIIVGLTYVTRQKSKTAELLKQQRDAISRTNDELKVLLDINQQQQQILAGQNEKLEELHREKDGFIGVIAHDLRSPLNRATGLASILPLSGPLNGEQQEIIDRINKVCNDGNQLINDLLEINEVESKTEDLHYTQILLPDFIEEIFKNYAPALNKKNITLSLSSQFNQAVHISTDAYYLNRIIDNLVSNAIKFSPKGGNIKGTLIANDTSFALSIKDEGQGIREDEKQHLFKKFKKLSARPTDGEHSTGLGLSIVKLLIEKLKGRIDVKSTVGRGTTFTIWLPRETGALLEKKSA